MPRGVVWPDKAQWNEALGKRILEDCKAKAAVQQLLRGGCIPGNLQSFLYAYTVSAPTILRKQSQRRDTAILGLKGVSGRLNRTADAMERLLGAKWHSQPSFSQFLKECELETEIISPDGTSTFTKSPPFLALAMPDALRGYSAFLAHLQGKLQRELSPRKVGKAFYLVEFVTYLQAIGFQPVPWEMLADIVDVAKSDDGKERTPDPTLLRNNFKNFVARNEDLYGEIQRDVAAYVEDCAKLPALERPTLVRWTLNRREQRSASTNSEN